MIHAMEKAGERLLLIINKLGMSRMELKKRMDVSQGTIVNILKRDKLTAGQLIKLRFLAVEHGVNLDYLKQKPNAPMFHDSIPEGFHISESERVGALERIEKELIHIKLEMKGMLTELNEVRKKYIEVLEENNKLKLRQKSDS